jgi:hypothetical protein
VAPVLRRVVAESSDIFLAEEALQGLATLLGPDSLAPPIKAPAETGAAPNP